jgi:beta-galactosidase
VHPADDLSGLRLYIIPHWVIIDPAWLPNLKQFVENGGTLVVGARCGTRDLNNNVIAETPPGVLRELCGVTVEEYSRCNDLGNRPVYMKTDAGETEIRAWYEVLQPDGAMVSATWRGRHLDDMPAITRNEVGTGQVIYVGTYLVAPFIEHILPVWISEAGLEPLWADAPPEVEVVVREKRGSDLWFFINHNDAEVRLESMPEGTNLISGETSGGALTLERNGVAVIYAD